MTFPLQYGEGDCDGIMLTGEGVSASAEETSISIEVSMTSAKVEIEGPSDKWFAYGLDNNVMNGMHAIHSIGNYLNQHNH